jgi:EmrB/QacA subfamily drug resistance transporter
MVTQPSVESRPKLGWTLALTSLAFFMVSLDVLVVVTALPAIHRELGASLASLQWTINAYALAYAASITTSAALGDRYGRRRVFGLGLALFALTSAACAVSPSIEVLVAARVIQGIGAGVIMPLSLTILTTAFPPERRGAIVGIWGGIAGIAVAGGPLIGGAITQGLTWHWIFWLNVPIGLVAALLARGQLTETVGPPTRLDLFAVALVSGGAGGIVLGMVQVSELGWASTRSITTLVVGVALIVSFIAWELRAAEPMLPIRLFHSLTFSAANTTGFFMTGALFGAVFLVAQYFQLALGNSPFDTGLRVLPWTATPLVIAPLAGALSDRIGRRPLMVGGMILQGASFAWFASLAAPGVDYWQLAIPMALAGIGVSMVLPVAPTAALSAVARADMGKASGVSSTLQRFGSAFGVAVATSVFAAWGSLATPDAFISGFRPALTVVAGLSLLGAVTALAVVTPRMLAAAPGGHDTGVTAPATASVALDQLA